MTGKIVQLNYKYSLDKKGDVLMSITGEMIISGFISKIVSDGVDIPENLIKKSVKDADKKRRDKNQSIETRIYQVTIDAIKAFTKREYKGQDVLYDAAESIIIGFKNSNNSVETVRSGLKMLGLQVTSETCEEFLKTLYHEICIDKNDILYRQIILIQGGQTFDAVREGFDVSSKNDEETHKKLDYLIEKQNGKEIQGVKYLVNSPIVNRADEYAQRWSKNVFLNNFNKRDKNAGVNIKLQEIYPEKNLPHYKWKSDDEESADLKELLREYIVDNDEKKMLLILGQAGIGKSTLITWIMANLVEKKENILVYQFASDLGNVNWQGYNLLDEIFATIGLEYKELEGKVLILDGFDEIYVKDDRERILYKMNQELKKKNFLKKFSIIITCRENYVNNARLEGIEYITLQTLDERQIRSFCKIYEEIITRKNSELRVNKSSEIGINKIIKKKDIMGVPLILYMVLALDVNIERSSSIVDIYDQIFSLKGGGIYDRGYDIEHRINQPEIKRHIHHISHRISFWMFENNAVKATISQEKFEEICENEMQESGEKGEEIQSDTLIGNFFKLNHCEGNGTDELQFVHRSIYEYFVAEYFFESLNSLKSKEEIAGKLGELLKSGCLSEQILEFIKHKFDSVKGFNFPEIVKNIFNIMLRDGMTYYTKKRYKNIIEQEKKIFSNMLEIVGLWNSALGEINDEIIIYLQCNRGNNLNLKGIKLGTKSFAVKGGALRGVDLSGANLNDADLKEINLKGARLNGANLSGADLRRADLSKAELIGVRLNGADLRGTNLNDTDLRNAHFDKADLRSTYLRGADLGGADLSKAYLSEADLGRTDLGETYLNEVYLRETNLNGTLFNEKQVNILYRKYNLNLCDVLFSETDEIVTYQEYCCNRKKVE